MLTLTWRQAPLFSSHGQETEVWRSKQLAPNHTNGEQAPEPRASACDVNQSPPLCLLNAMPSNMLIPLNCNKFPLIIILGARPLTLSCVQAAFYFDSLSSVLGADAGEGQKTVQ